MKQGLFYRTKKGNEYSVNIRRTEGNYVIIYFENDSSNFPDKEEIEEFNKVAACMRVSINTDLCIASFKIKEEEKK
jgi:hypothetical protein